MQTQSPLPNPNGMSDEGWGYGNVGAAAVPSASASAQPPSGQLVGGGGKADQAQPAQTPWAAAVA